jgi:outer membrane protein TolC
VTRNIRVVLLACSSCAGAYAQFAATAPGPTSRAVQLPLSGRTTQTGGVATVQSPTPPGVPSVDTVNIQVDVQGTFQGSIPSAATGVPIVVSLADAVRRGLQFNLGPVTLRNIELQARGTKLQARSALLPNLNSYLTETVQQIDLAALGFRPGPGSPFPAVVGPFNYFDLRTRLTQNVLDLTVIRNNRAVEETVTAARYATLDARDLVTLGVTGAYLEILASAARVDSARAQVATATASYEQAVDRFKAGVAARIEMTRTQVELQTEQQRLTSLETLLAKQKIQLARVIGLSPDQEYTLADVLAFNPTPVPTVVQALENAYAYRSDLKSAGVQVRAAESTLDAARAERYPTVDLAADYGVIGPTPGNSHGTFSVVGGLRVPVFQGGRIRGDIEQARATLEQRRAEYQDLRGQVDADVRNALLDLNATAAQVKVAESNRGLAADTLTQARDRFAAGVADSLEVVQAQEAVAVAEQDYISALFAYNLARASLARATGQAAPPIP